MELTSDIRARLSAFKAFASSLPVRFALVPLAGFGVATAYSGLAGLGVAVLVLVTS